MFTGIVEEIGIVESVEKNRDNYKLTVACREILTDSKLGDSIATNGVCLTISNLYKNKFVADIMPETMRSSNLESLCRGSKVNLERAMQLGGRFGGHIVSGHVDGTAFIKNIERQKNAVIFKFSTTEEITKYIVKKGSVCIDGTSLTVVKVEKEMFSVSLIPHTSANTIMKSKNIGEKVNIECDMLAKYIEKLNKKEESKKRIDLNFLKENGF